MIINLKDIQIIEGKIVKQCIPLEMDGFHCRLGAFPVLRKRNINFTFTNISMNKILAEADWKMTLGIPCDRCLTRVEKDFSFHTMRKWDFINNKEEEESLLEADYLDGHFLDTEKFVYHELLCNWPMKVLCREDCKGKRKKCGMDWNKNSCQCEQEELDPRMSVIKSLFKQC